VTESAARRSGFRRELGVWDSTVIVAGAIIGVGIFVRDPDGQLLELLPMSYREQLDAT